LTDEAEKHKTQLVINWLLRCRYDFERNRLSVFLAPNDFDVPVLKEQCSLKIELCD